MSGIQLLLTLILLKFDMTFKIKKQLQKKCRRFDYNK